MKKYQGGDVTFILILVVLILGLGGLVYYQHGENQKLVSTVATVKADLKAATEANESLKKDLVTNRELNSASQETLLERDKTIREQSDKIRKLENVLPIPIPKAKEPATTQEHEANSQKRILLIWQTYCLDNPSQTCVQGATS